MTGSVPIDPGRVRDAAFDVAREGHAGEEAAEAAVRAQEALNVAALRLKAQLLMGLIRFAGIRHAHDAAQCLDRVGFERLAVRLGWPGADLADALQTVATEYAPAVLGTPGPTSRTPVDPDAPSTGTGRWGRLLALVRRLRAWLADEQYGRGGSDAVPLGRIIDAADACIARCEQLLPEIPAMLANPLSTLELWRRKGRGCSERLRALEAALDGWDRICLLWFDAGSPHARQALIPEIAALSRTGSSGEAWCAPSAQAAAGLSSMCDGNDWQQQKLIRNRRIRTRELTIGLESAWAA